MVRDYACKKRRPRHLLSAQIIGWAFPSGDVNRIGVGSYRGDSRLVQSLDGFLSTLDADREEVHGGLFTHGLRPPIVDNVFLVGDAAGHCLPFTGEGIRPALFFGTQLGRLLGRVLDGDATRETVESEYEALVAEYAPGYRLLCRVQRWVPRLPLPVVAAIAAAIHAPPVRPQWLPRYMGAFRIPAVDAPSKLTVAV